MKIPLPCCLVLHAQRGLGNECFHGTRQGNKKTRTRNLAGRLRARVLVHVRPAWAHTCGCKSRHKLATVSEAKRNCTRATECGKEAWSVICGPMYKNRIQGVAEQGERACNREALVAKARLRRSGGRAEKVCVLTWGDLALCSIGRRCRAGARSQQRS